MLRVDEDGWEGYVVYGYGGGRGETAAEDIQTAKGVLGCAESERILLKGEARDAGGRKNPVTEAGWIERQGAGRAVESPLGAA